MNNRIKSLSNESLVLLTLRALQNIDNAMTRYGESGSNPYGHGGALSFGWDMPTASAIFPRLTRMLYALKDEGRARGISGVKYVSHRIGKRAKKNKGKIVYTLAA